MMLSSDVCESSEEVHYILESLLIKQFLNHDKDNQTLITFDLISE